MTLSYISLCFPLKFALREKKKKKSDLHGLKRAIANHPLQWPMLQVLLVHANKRVQHEKRGKQNEVALPTK